MRPHGRVTIQAITMPHDRMLASRDTYTWIQKYIFPPGGLLPSEDAIADITAQHTGLRTVDVSWMGSHYAETLRLWRERFLHRGEAVHALGVRRGVRADVGAVPGVLRGRLPLGLPRRAAVDIRTDIAADMTTQVRPAARLRLVTTDLDVLLRRVARRDAEAFAQFYDHTKARVFGLVTRVLRDPGYSEETTQEIYLQVWHNAGGYDPAAGSPLAWLMTLAHRRAVDRVRSEQSASQRESRYGAASVDTPPPTTSRIR